MLTSDTVFEKQLFAMLCINIIYVMSVKKTEYRKANSKQHNVSSYAAISDIALPLSLFISVDYGSIDHSAMSSIFAF